MKMNKYKLIPLCICFIVIGIFGLLFSFYSSRTPVTTTVNTREQPITFSSAPQTDSDGNIYYPSTENSFIQVYDEKLMYKYTIVLPSNGGYFDWGIDENNVLHVLISRTNEYIQVSGTEVVSAEKLSAELADETVGTIRTMKNYINIEQKPNSPIFPLPIAFYGLVVLAGAGGIMVIFRKEIAKYKRG